MAVRAAKRQYFSVLIAISDSHSAALFKVTQALLDKNLEIHLEGHAEEFAQHLLDKIYQIHSKLDSSFDSDSVEVPRGQTRPVIQEQFDLVGLVEVDTVLMTVSSVTCSLNPCPSCLVEAAWGGEDGMWLDPSDGEFFPERGLFHNFLRGSSSSLLKRPSLDLTVSID